MPFAWEHLRSKAGTQLDEGLDPSSLFDSGTRPQAQVFSSPIEVRWQP